MKSSNVCNLRQKFPMYCIYEQGMMLQNDLIYMNNNLKYISCWKHQHSQQDICYKLYALFGVFLYLVIWSVIQQYLHLRLYSGFIGHSRVDIICSLCCYVVQNNSHSNFVNKCFHDERQNNRYPKPFSFTIVAYQYWHYLSYYGVTYIKETMNACSNRSCS